MTWSADWLSCVFFSSQSVGAADALQDWHRVFGGATPQRYQQNPHPAGSSQAMGIVGSYQVVIGAQPGRTELTLLPPPNDQTSQIAANPELLAPSITNVEHALDTLRGHASRFVAGQNAMRVALVANLSEKTSDQAAAVALFKRVTSLEWLPEGASDLLFGFNTILEFSVASTKVQINRLRRWGTVTQKIGIFTLQTALGAPNLMQPVDVHAAFLNIDLNTVPRLVPFADSESDLLFDNLITEAKRIISEGHIDRTGHA